MGDRDRRVALAATPRASIDDELRVLHVVGHPGCATITVGDDAGAAAYERHVRHLAEGLSYHYVSACLRSSSSTCSRTIGKAHRPARHGVSPGLAPEHLPEAVVNATSRPTQGRRGAASRERGVAGLWARHARAVDLRVVLLPARCLRAVDLAPIRRASTRVAPSSCSALDERRQATWWLALERHATVIATYSRTA